MAQRGGGRASARTDRNIFESPMHSACGGATPSPGSNSVDHSVDLSQREVMKNRFSDMMTKARNKSVELAKAENVNISLTSDLSLLKPFNPLWIRSEYWEKMIDEVWNTDKWKRKSESVKKNRNKMEHDSISKHCWSSIPISHHMDLLESKLRRPPTCLEIFEKTHRTKKAQEGTSNTD
ncbi:hypothetical protein L1887_06371 [Cichorium endivia]|nr:hypothetical protein L1887_06371 [Cichorium endivia]